MTSLAAQFVISACVQECTARIDAVFDDYGVEFIETGTIALRYAAREYLLEGPTFWITAPGVRYQYQSASENVHWRHHYIRVTGARVLAWVEEGLLPFNPQPVAKGTEYGLRCERIIALSRRVDQLGRLTATHQLEGLLLELAAQRATQNVQPIWLQELLALLHATPGKHLDYKQLAEQQGMALVTLRRRFKDITGVALHTYLMRLRIEVARDLLATSDLPIKAIADKLGYRDIYFFHRQFRQFVGITPGQYRQRLLQ